MNIPKPTRGAASAERRQRRARIETQERAAKLAAKMRDGHRCQFPGCGVTPVEAMHEVDKGIGGDGGRFSCRPEHFTSGCAEHHRGRRSVHSAHVAFHRHPGDFVSWWTRESLGEPLALLAVTDKYGHVTVQILRVDRCEQGRVMCPHEERARRDSESRAGSVDALLAGDAATRQE